MNDDWESLADEIASMGFTYGFHKLMLQGGLAVWQADAYSKDAYRHIARGETLLTTFLDLKRLIAERAGR